MIEQTIQCINPIEDYKAIEVAKILCVMPYK